MGNIHHPHDVYFERSPPIVRNEIDEREAELSRADSGAVNDVVDGPNPSPRFFEGTANSQAVRYVNPRPQRTHLAPADDSGRGLADARGKIPEGDRTAL